MNQIKLYDLVNKFSTYLNMSESTPQDEINEVNKRNK